jgi:hypothetical protein
MIVARGISRGVAHGIARGVAGSDSQDVPRTISGFAYPGETLTSTAAGQWFVDDVAVVGETGETYEVNLLDIGKPIRCDNSNALTCWKPSDIAGVSAFWWSRGGVITSIDPDTLATDGQTVRRWEDRTTPPFNANQTVGANQPIYRATGQSGGPSVEFDGSDDFLDINNTSAFRNIGQGYLFAGARDTNPTGGNSSHNLINYSVGDGSGTRLGLQTRTGAGNEFRIVARRLDTDTATTAATPSNSNYNVLCAHGDYSNGFARLRVNGSVVASTALPTSGNTSDTNSQSSEIASNPSLTNFFIGHIACIIIANQSLSATNLSRIERFVGLQGGLNIPLV